MNRAKEFPGELTSTVEGPEIEPCLLSAESVLNLLKLILAGSPLPGSGILERELEGDFGEFGAGAIRCGEGEVASGLRFYGAEDIGGARGAEGHPIR